MKNIHRTELNDQQRALVVANMKHADKIAANYAKRGVPIEDLQQEARLALCYAAMRFDPENGCSLATFSTLYINGFLCKFIMRHGYTSYLSKNQRIFVRVISLERLWHHDEDDDMNWEELIGGEDDDEDAEREDAAELLNTLMKSLTDEERELISARYGLEGDPVEVAEYAERMGISPSSVYRRCREILIKMADYAEKYKVER